MSVDCEKIAFSMIGIPMLVTSVFEVFIGMWLLYTRLGPSALASVAVVILILPAQVLMGNMVNKAKSSKLEAMDQRVRVMNELLSAIKTIKMYAWENSFRQRIARYRATEITQLKKIGVAWALMCIMFTSLPLVMSLLTFVVYTLVGGSKGPEGTNQGGVLDAATVFVSITLFARLAQPLGRLSGISSQLIAMWVCFGRIQTYLMEEEVDPSQVEHLKREQGRCVHGSDQYDIPAVVINNGVFAWSSALDEQKRLQAAAAAVAAAATIGEGTDKNRNERANEPILPTDGASTAQATTSNTSPSGTDPLPTLSDINLTIAHGSLAIIVGRIGQGKSSLLSAMVGEMYKQHGQVQICGSVAYVPQQAWIINASLRDNILFGKPFDQQVYDRVLMACGLIPDLELLPARDRTEIGERGINLSGGQKQRVSLARAAYQDADIYLMDDPLSAVDAHVDQHLWDMLIGPEGILKNKTKVLVTHGIHHLKDADQIIVMTGGQISEKGEYQQLIQSQGAFYQLMNEYAVQEQKKSEEECEDETETVGSEGEEHRQEDQGRSRAKKDVAVVAPSTKDDAQLVLAEEVAAGNVGWALFHRYVRSATYWYSFLSLFLYILSQASQIGINVWMQHWANQSESYQRSSAGTFLGVFAALVVSYMCLDIGVNLIIFRGAGVRSSTLLHDKLLYKVLHLPMSFFDTTPVGRIINRFSTDINNLDEEMPSNITDIYYFLTMVLGTVIVISFTLPWFLALVPVLILFYFLIQRYYMATSRSLKRIHMISKSPLYQHFDETLAGVSTLRAMRCTAQFKEANAFKSDKSANAHFAFTTANRWLNIRLEILGAVIVLVTSLLCVWKREEVGPGKAGLALSYALTVTFTITYLVTSLGALQNQLVSVERIQEYCEKNPEAPLTLADMTSHDPQKIGVETIDAVNKDLIENGKWPTRGHIVFKNYSTRYREGMNLVLKNVSFEVQPGERLGIVGRTGAGKSSLTLALFRIVEAANSHWAKASYNLTDQDVAMMTLLNNTSGNPNANVASADTAPGQQRNEEEEEEDLQTVDMQENGGSIEIDGVDISMIGLQDLRSHLSIIPQDPMLFVGTVRENLDPSTEHSDAELWEALERAHLKSFISTLEGTLSFQVASGGENFSVGQRSLICLARALLRKTKILVLDEATAAVDVETDDLILKTVREEFKDRTILTIAHRIKTVMDSDKILVLEKGKMQEFGAPKELLKRYDRSLFYRLAERAGALS
ncbi:Canalicular multispecific organic anion transporter 2 [Mortierella claussenii]|nr:Canalicular multispecific organic anion transporter 2 [Mortierella claussenii]